MPRSAAALPLEMRAQQLPRQRRRLLHAGNDFHPRVVQLAAQIGPQIARVIVRLEYGVEKLHADLGRALLDAGRNFQFGPERVFEEVFQVPAQVVQVLRAQRKRKTGDGRLARRAAAFERDLNAVPIRPVPAIPASNPPPKSRSQRPQKNKSSKI